MSLICESEMGGEYELEAAAAGASAGGGGGGLDMALIEGLARHNKRNRVAMTI
jgi:hypothetical protein